MAKISDIAKRANVSESAVSFALNNKPGVSESKRKEILEIAKELNFKPRKRAASNGSAGRIGFLRIVKHGNILNRDHDAFISDYIYGINQACKDNKFDIDLLDFEGCNEQLVNSIDKQRFQGVVVLGTELSPDDINLFRNVETPLVFLDTYYRFVKFNFVTMNNLDALFDIVSHLSSRGAKTIEFVTADSVCANIREREAAFGIVMRELGLAGDGVILHQMPSTFTGAYEGMSALIASGHQNPDAYVCANDIMALGCMKALKEKGFNIPGDVSITGFDDLPGSARTDPGLTCYQVPKREIGQSGADLLFEAIRRGGERFSSIKSMVDGQLIVRASTA